MTSARETPMKNNISKMSITNNEMVLPPGLPELALLLVDAPPARRSDLPFPPSQLFAENAWLKFLRRADVGIRISENRKVVRDKGRKNTWTYQVVTVRVDEPVPIIRVLEHVFHVGSNQFLRELPILVLELLKAFQMGLYDLDSLAGESSSPPACPLR